MRRKIHVKIKTQAIVKQSSSVTLVIDENWYASFTASKQRKVNFALHHLHFKYLYAIKSLKLLHKLTISLGVQFTNLCLVKAKIAIFHTADLYTREPEYPSTLQPMKIIIMMRQDIPEQKLAQNGCLLKHIMFPHASCLQTISLIAIVTLLA